MSTSEATPQQVMSQLFELLISQYLDDVIEEAAADETGAAILDVVERVGKERAKQLIDDLAKHTANIIDAASRAGQMGLLAIVTPKVPGKGKVKGKRRK